jgi:predicted PurR-regulated permease PerM
MPIDKPAEAFNWRAIHWVVVLVVLGFFLHSVQTILSPFILFLLLVFMLSPYAGTRHHLLIVSAATVLTLIWALNATGFLLAPFMLAVAFAYLQHPLVTRMEKRRISRTWGTVLLALPTLAVIVLVFVFGIPALSAQVADFIRGAPQLLQTATQRLQGWESEMARHGMPLGDQSLTARLQQLQPDAVMAWLQQRQSALAGAAWRGITGVGRGLGAALTLLSYVFLTPIITFYLLRDWPLIIARMDELVPVPDRQRVGRFTSEFDRLLAGYVRGNVIESLIVGVLTWLGFLVLGFPYALTLAVMAAVFNLIPYVGLILTAIPAVVIAVFLPNPLWALGKVAIVFITVQTLDGSFIGPKVVGVILALSIFGFFFGFLGLLLAVPLAVLVKLIVEHALVRYRASRLYSGGPSVAAPD